MGEAIGGEGVQEFGGLVYCFQCSTMSLVILEERGSPLWSMRLPRSSLATC